jgi:hypothetical protein
MRLHGLATMPVDVPPPAAPDGEAPTPARWEAAAVAATPPAGDPAGAALAGAALAGAPGLALLPAAVAAAALPDADELQAARTMTRIARTPYRSMCIAKPPL